MSRCPEEGVDVESQMWIVRMTLMSEPGGLRVDGLSSMMLKWKWSRLAAATAIGPVALLRVVP
jgi:hypothetical protein